MNRSNGSCSLRIASRQSKSWPSTFSCLNLSFFYIILLEFLCVLRAAFYVILVSSRKVTHENLWDERGLGGARALGRVGAGHFFVNYVISSKLWGNFMLNQFVDVKEFLELLCAPKDSWQDDPREITKVLRQREGGSRNLCQSLAVWSRNLWTKAKHLWPQNTSRYSRKMQKRGVNWRQSWRQGVWECQRSILCQSRIMFLGE